MHSHLLRAWQETLQWQQYLCVVQETDENAFAFAEDLGMRGTPEGDAADLLATMEDVTVASASLGQVYRATVGNKTVAVKVQRPGVLKEVAADSVIVRFGASVVVRFFVSLP